MSLIRKLEIAEAGLLCCDFNDVCEGEVTHQVCEVAGGDRKYYCLEHTEQLREKLFPK